MMNRQMFLNVLLNAVAAGTLLTDTKVTEAISLYPGDRISVLIGRARTAAATRSDEFKDKSVSPAYAAWMAETDKIFDLIQTEFPVNPSHDEMKFFFCGLTQADGLDEVSLRRISPDLIPLAVFRSLVITGVVRLQFVGQMPSMGAYLHRMRSLYEAANI